MKTNFTHLKFTEHKHLPNATKACHIFDNGYGVSVIQGPHTYGGDAGLYEAAILDNGEITYSSGITDDVIGWLTEDDISSLLFEVSNLKANE